MLRLPLKDTTVTSEIREGAFEQGQTWSCKVSGKSLSEVFSWWSYRTTRSLIYPLSSHHNSTTVWPPPYSEHCRAVNISTLKGTFGIALSGAEYSSEPICWQQCWHLEQWSRNRSIKTSTTYNYGQSPFTAKHHDPSQTEACEKIHTPSEWQDLIRTWQEIYYFWAGLTKVTGMLRCISSTQNGIFGK